MFPGLEAGVTDATGLIRDSDSPLAFLEIFDMSTIDDDFREDDLRDICCSGEDGGER